VVYGHIPGAVATFLRSYQRKRPMARGLITVRLTPIRREVDCNSLLLWRLAKQVA